MASDTCQCVRRKNCRIWRKLPEQTSTAYRYLFGKLDDVIDAQATVIYSPAGIANRIPLTALSVDDETTLGDKYNLMACANPTELFKKGRDSGFEIGQMKVALWGGIDYGTSVSDSDKEPKTRAVLRGDNLTYLPGSRNEVESFSRTLGRNVGSVTLRTGKMATEAS